MGATNYSNLWVGKGDANQAFSELREDARDYYGHQEGYSGDIQTAEGFRTYTEGHPRFDTESFYKWEEKETYDMHRGDCFCIELKGAALKRQRDMRPYLRGKKGVRAFYFFGLGRC